MLKTGQMPVWLCRDLAGACECAGPSPASGLRGCSPRDRFGRPTHHPAGSLGSSGVSKQLAACPFSLLRPDVYRYGRNPSTSAVTKPIDYLLSHIQGQAHFSRDLGWGTKEHPTGRTLITAGLRGSICASPKRVAQR